MISEKMKEYVEKSSPIRAMFEEGKKMAQIYGEENVYDFSLGNPSIEPPTKVTKTMIKILKEENPNFVHGYMNNSGFEDVRRKIAESLNRRFDTSLKENNIIMTVGAAGGLNVILKTLLNPEDEVIVFAPFFGEYAHYVRNYDGKLIVAPPNTDTFQPNLEEFSKLLSKKTKAVLMNSPNNPTGVVYSENTIKEIAELLSQAQKKFETSIYLISDEPYRELVYDGAEAPYVTKYYKNAIVGYSFSKSLSLPGERIGYLVLPDQLDDFEWITAAANVANRILGFVNAPSLLQRTVAECLDSKADIEQYDRNRILLYESLKKFGYSLMKPQGAFYLFVKSPVEDENDFVNTAKKYHLLLVPGSSFGCPGYVRISYCVTYEMIQRSLPAWKVLAKEYHLAGKE